jgi:hypothetical protein
MFTRLANYLRRILGSFFYWIGWALAVLVIAQAIILSLTTGGPVVALLIGGGGVVVWLIGLGLYTLLVRPSGSSLQ